MKNNLLFLVLLIANYTTYSQVGIGTPMPNSSSQLEVVASNKGLLIPRISLTSSTDAATITNGNVNSLLVFNTAAISDIKPGYYYWYDNKWNRIVVSNEITAAPGTVIYNPTTQQFTYVDATGSTQIIDFSQIVKSNETVTTIVNNGGGSYTYINEAGTAVTIDVVGDVTSNFSTIANNPAVTNIIQQISNNSEGNVTFNSTTNEFSYVDASGNPQIINISQIIKANETITTLDKNASNNGEYTYTSENATSTTINVVGDVINNASTILNNPAFATELTNIIKSNETVTSLVYDGTANTLIYTDEKAVSTTVNLLDLVGNAETQTTLVYDPAAKTLTYNGESGTPTIINLLDLVGDAETITTILPIVTTGNTIATYNNEAGGTPTEIKETTTTLIQDNATGAITYNNEAGIGSVTQVKSQDSGNILTIGSDGGALLTPSSITSATTVSNASAVNTATVTVNGIASTGAPIINSNEISVTGSSLTSTVNGVASTALDLGAVISASTTNTLSLSGNTLTSNVNGVSSTSAAVGSVSNASAVNIATVTVNGIASTGAPIINSNEISVTGSSLTSTVNGVASTALDLGPVISAATTNNLTAVNGNLISTVNGVASTPAVPVLIAADNGLTAANGNVQLGGTLINPTTIIANPTNTLAIQGLIPGDPLDNVIVIDQFGVLKSISSNEFNINNWNINGNTGIQSSLHFLGTLDDADIVFKRNNIISGKLQTNNTSFGVSALPDPSGGADNVAIGTSALENNNVGQRNSALGFSAMAENTAGIENTGVGYYALNSNTIGGQNTAFGNYAFQGNTTGNRNTSIGYYSGYMGVGEDITLLGAFTAFTDGIFNATAIGSGASVNTSNSLILGALKTNIGIGTDSPANSLHVISYDNLDPIRFEGLKPSSSSSDLTVVIDATGVLKTKAAVVTGMRSISGDYTFSPDDYTIIARNLTNDITITLPDAALNPGRILIINQFNLVKPDTSPLVVNFNVHVIYSDTEAFPYISTSIFGGPRGQSVKITLQSDGTDWYVVSYTI